MAPGPLFPTANNFSWVGIGFIWETDYRKPNPNKFSANTGVLLMCLLVAVVVAAAASYMYFVVDGIVLLLPSCVAILCTR